VVEIGSPGSPSPGSWALLPADLAGLAGSSRMRSIPLDPPAHVAGCVEKAVEAFRNAVA
jgi:hypothetical protein